MTIQIQRMLGLLHTKLQALEISLRHNKAGYEMQCQICMKCGRTPPLEARKCHPCHNAMLYQKYCTGESRIAELFATLEKEELWPSVKSFGICSLSDIVFRLACVKTDIRHSCACGSRCPLIYELEGLCKAAQQVKVDITGLCLSCVRSGRWNENQACSCIN